MYIRFTILPVNLFFRLCEYNVFLLLFLFLLKALCFFFHILLNDILDVFKLPKHMGNKLGLNSHLRKMISIEN